MPRTRLLSTHEEDVLAGWIVFNDSEGESTTIPDIKEFAEDAFGVILKESWLSKFMKRHDLSLKTPAKHARSELDPERKADAIDFILYIRELQLPRENLIVLIRTAFLDENARVVKQIAPIGVPVIRDDITPKGYRDMVYVALKADGDRSPLYIETPNPNIKTETSDLMIVRYLPQRDRGETDELGMTRNERGFYMWLKAMKNADFFEDADFLIVDSEAPIYHPRITKLAKDLDLNIIPFERDLKMLHEPLNTDFTNIFKANFRRARDANRGQLKTRLIRDAYYDVDEENIVQYFRHVGLIGHEKAHVVVDALMEENEGPQIKPKHAKQLLAYRAWCYQNSMIP